LTYKKRTAESGDFGGLQWGIKTRSGVLVEGLIDVDAKRTTTNDYYYLSNLFQF